MTKKLNSKGAAIIVFLISGALFFGFTMLFRISLANVTEMRPTTALTPVLGMIFGLPAALGCAVANLAADLISSYGISYAAISFVQQLVFGMVPYLLWKRLNKEHDGDEFRLDSISRLLKFCLVMLIDALLIVIFTGIVNHAYSVTDFLSMNNLYLFINSFDSGLLFGCPLLILGHLLQRQLDNMKSGQKKKVLDFTLNERMILNTIITGIGICMLIGAAVYLTDKLNTSGTAVSIWGQMYLFETLALNFYFALSMGFMWFTEKRIAKPVEQLSSIAESYYVEHATDEQRNDMISACEKYASDTTEVGNLARSYISMITDLDRYVENLKSITAEKERINAELTLASDIQAHMLPCIFPAFPEHDEFDIYATMTPAKEVGGDFYDFFMIDESHFAVVVSDVSGKGVPAALFMVIAKTLIKNYAQMGLAPEKVFTTVNNLLCDGNDAGLFVTSWLGIIDLSSGKLTYVNAGHNPPLLKHGDGGFEYLRSRPAFVLAGMEGMKYRQNEIELNPADRLFLYTDGVTEATNGNKQLYGEERLLDYMNAHAGDNAEDILHGLKSDIDGFVGKAEQFDDITMLMFDYKRKLGGNNLTEKVFPADVSALSDVLAFIEQQLEKANCPMKTVTQICVAIEEVFVNVAHYAYKDGKGDAKIAFGFDESSRTATFVLSDSGVPFNPLQKPDPDITLSANEREIGGLGIFITKKTMDDVSYRYENGENILTMTKKL
ncbi:MAG: SpoIIE family protein phosphatase [Acutalibacteraceae bacterium]